MSIIIANISSFFISLMLLPLVIKVSKSINLLDNPDIRKTHAVSTPVLGGVAILIGFIIALLFSVSFVELIQLKYLLFGIMIIFFMGVRDDISGLLARHKLFAQVFAAFLVVGFSDIRLDGFYGIMGIGEMPGWFTFLFSIFVIVALTNSFNLIDGIDGLAGSVGLLILLFFGIVFYLNGDEAFAALCASLAGATFAFLFFNWHPARIFMGDTGSMVIGFVVSTCAIQFINLLPSTYSGIFGIKSTVALATAALILPILDTTRVFIIRFWHGQNPLDPDRGHLHHELLRLGFSDRQVTITLLLFNFTVLLGTLSLNTYFGNGILILIISVFCCCLVLGLELRLIKLRNEKAMTKSNGNSDLYISKSA
jgi:UDP-GlcNAc:undecaprenyl-phosphate GlcNAc-1-phosphate transferase